MVCKSNPFCSKTYSLFYQDFITFFRTMLTSPCMNMKKIFHFVPLLFTIPPMARAFHAQLTRICRQNRILRVIEGQDEFITRFSAMSIKQENRRSSAQEEHHKLVEYVEKRDLESFTELMGKHIERSKENCLAALAAQKQNRDL